MPHAQSTDLTGAEEPEFVASPQGRKTSIAFWTKQFSNVEASQFPRLPSLAYVPRPSASTSHHVEGLGWESSAFKPTVFVRLAWAILQAQYTAKQDVVFGAAMGHSGIVFPNRIVLDGNANVFELMGKLQHLAEQMYRHSHIGADAIGGVSDDADAACDFQTVLLLISRESGNQTAEADGGRRRSVGESYALTLECNIELDRLTIRFVYDPAIMTDWQTQRMGEQLGHVLRQLLMQPQSRLSDISVSSENAHVPESRRNSVAVPETPMSSRQPSMIGPRGSINPRASLVIPQIPLVADTAVGFAPLKGIPETAAHEMSTLETQLKQLWMQVLGMKDQSSIDASSNWIQMGGDSISAMRLVATARNWGLELSVADVVSAPQLADMAQRTKKAHRPSVVAHNVGSAAPSIGMALLPVTPFQKQALAGSIDRAPMWNDYYAFDLPPSMETSTVAAVCHALVQHFDSLRTVFVQLQGEYYQAILPSLEAPLEQVEFIGDINKSSAAVMQKDFARTITLGHSLLQMYLLRKGESHLRLIFRSSQAHTDSISMSLITAALSELCAGRALTKAPSFSDFISQLNIERPESQEHWRKLLSGASMTTIPPHPNSAPDDTLLLSAETVLQFPTKTAATAATVFTAASALALARLVGAQDEVVFGRLVSGRAALPAELQNVAGSCVNAVPVRLNIKRKESLLKQVQDQYLAGLPHENVDFLSYADDCFVPERTIGSSVIEDDHILSDEVAPDAVPAHNGAPAVQPPAAASGRPPLFREVSFDPSPGLKNNFASGDGSKSVRSHRIVHENGSDPIRHGSTSSVNSVGEPDFGLLTSFQSFSTQANVTTVAQKLIGTRPQVPRSNAITLLATQVEGKKGMLHILATAKSSVQTQERLEALLREVARALGEI